MLEEQTITIKPVIKKLAGKYTKETAIFIGKLKVAGYWWDSTKSKKDLHQYKVVGHLPFIRTDLGKFVTEEECEAKLIDVAKYVINQLTEEL